MKKRIVSLLLTSVMAASLVLGGCGKSASTEAPAETAGGSAAEEAPAESAGGDGASEEAAVGTPPEVSHDEELVVEFYNVASNYQGIQPGWFGKAVKDKFNMSLNIIAPQVSGDGEALYQTRTAAGNLGDIVLLDNSQMLECVDVGLIADISEDIKNYPNLMKYYEQIKLFNEQIGADGIWGIPTEMNSNGPTAFKGRQIDSMPRVPWDLYTELGRPELKNLDDLLKLLADMQAAHPTNENGDPAYAISMWKDWDGTSIENVNQLTKWYGQQVNGSVLISDDNTIIPLNDKNGAYYKMLKFFFDANQMGIVDPDSATQDWNATVDKMRTRRMYLIWNNWMTGHSNTPEKGEAGKNYVALPVGDMRFFQQSDPYYGSGRVFGIGAQVSEENKLRILEFLDWYASTEGLELQHGGNEGFIYTVREDGTFELTEDGYNRFAGELLVPEELGGGNWNDGNNQINQWIVGSVEIDPNTGEPYDTGSWSASIEKNNTKTTKEYNEFFGCEHEVDYVTKNGMCSPIPNINKVLEIDTTDIGLIRSQCKTIVCDSSWKAIFAKDEAEFNAIWDDMCTQLEGFGWNDLVEFDTAKYQVVIDARKEAMGQ